MAKPKTITCLDCPGRPAPGRRGLCGTCYFKRWKAGTLADLPGSGRRVNPPPLPPGVTYRQVNYWVRRGLLTPQNGGRGTGYHLRWDESELVVLERMGRLVTAGLTPDAAVKVARDHIACELAPGIYVLVRRPDGGHGRG